MDGGGCINVGGCVVGECFVDVGGCVDGEVGANG